MFENKHKINENYKKYIKYMFNYKINFNFIA